MATFSSTAVSSGTPKGAYVWLELKEAKKSAGVSTITWTLKGRGRSTSPKYFNTKGTVTIYQGSTKKLGLDLANYNTEQGDTGKVARYDDHQWASGTFTVTHDASGAAALTVTINPTYIYSSKSGLKTTGTMNLTKNAAYTKCTAPTSVSFDKPVYKPGDTMTISWTKGAVGTGLTFKYYEVSYRYGTGDWVKSEDKYTDLKAEIKPTTFASNRGKTISARVRMICDNSSYHSDYTSSTSSKNPIVNTLPAKPTVTISIPSQGKGTDDLKVPYGGKRTITVTAGSANDSGQTAKIKYSVDGVEKSAVSSPLTLEVTSSKEYVFYTYDGYEKSSGVTKKFVFNTQLSITVSISGDQGTPMGNYDGLVEYVYNPTVSVNRTGGQANGTYKYKLYTSSTLNGTYTLHSTVSSSTSSSLKITDVRAIKSPTTSGYYYKIGVTYNDGIETTTEVQTSAYYITRLPKATVTNGSNTTNYFSNSVTVTVDGLSGYTHFSLQVYNSSGVLQKSYTASGTSYTFNVSQDTVRGQAYTFKVKPYSSTFTPSGYTTSVTKTRVRLPAISSSTVRPSLSKTPNPLLNETVNLTFLNFLNTLTLDNTNETHLTLVESYGLATDTTTTLKLTAKNPSDSSKSVSKNINFNWFQTHASQSQCQIAITSLISTLFNASSLGLNVNEPNAQSVTLTLSFTNLYGDSISSTWTQQVDYVDSNTKPVVKSFSVAIKKNNKDSNLKFVSEGCTITPTISTTLYHKASSMRLQVGTGASDSTFGNIILDKTTNFSTATNSPSMDTQTFGAISDDSASNLYARVQVTTLAGQTSAWKYYNLNLSAKRLEPGQGTLKNGSWVNGKITVTFAVSDAGFTEGSYDLFSSAIYRGDDSTGVYFHNGVTDFTVYSKSRTLVFDVPEAWKSESFVKLKVKCTSKLFPLGNTAATTSADYSSKTWYSNELTIYQASPTLSYRKNKVGINYDYPDSKFSQAALVVGDHDSSNYVYFYSASAGKYVRIDLRNAEYNGDLNGRLNDSQTTSTISNFVINGGSWS